MQAGGHNPFANMHGLMADNVVELEVVTPDGKFQKVSECNNPELFWAFRGGGGGTYGIVTGGTIKVYPTFPVVVSRFFVNSTEPYDPKLMKAVAHFLQRGTTLRDKYGLQGYFYVYPNAFQSVLHLPDKFATLENAKKATEEIQVEMEKIAGSKHIEPKYYQHKSYKDWYVAEMGDDEMEEAGQKFHSWYDGSWGDAPSAEDVMMNPMLVIPFKIAESQREAKEAAAKTGKGKSTKIKRDDTAVAHSVLRTQPMGRTYLDSRLLSDKHVNSVSLDTLAKAVSDTFPKIVANHYSGFLYGGGAQAKPAKDAMGLLPAWRDATYHLIINAVPGDSRHDYDMRAFDKLFPDTGAYVNEASPGEPNWKVKFWGENYAKLETIKKTVDPDNLLWCSPCVGADMLTYDDERLCKNPNYPVKGPAPQTYNDPASKTGIASLPGKEGIHNPLAPIIQAWMVNKTLPSTMPASNFFKMAMGQGGSSGGRWSLGPPANAAVPAQAGHGHDGMVGMGAAPA
jgi:FAD/FMN-containing dehydrogenase